VLLGRGILRLIVIIIIVIMPTRGLHRGSTRRWPTMHMVHRVLLVQQQVSRLTVAL
jgi:hypothetical protein